MVNKLELKDELMTIGYSSEIQGFELSEPYHRLYISFVVIEGRRPSPNVGSIPPIGRPGIKRSKKIQCCLSG